ncbi:MAG: radical SAM protein [archaeon]
MKLNKINSFAVSYTNKCNIECRHCIVDCGPDKGEKLDFERFLLFVGRFKEFGVKSLEVTGGESFLFFDELVKIFSEAKKLGVSSSLISNGLWGFSEENAERVVSELVGAGLKGLYISSDEFHLEFVPAKSVFNIVDAVMKRKEKVKAVIKFCYSRNYSFFDFLTENAGYFKNLKKKYPKKNLNVLVQPVIPLGRAIEKVPKENCVAGKKTTEKLCPMLGSPFINHDGNVFFCCNGSELSNPLEGVFFLGNFYSDSFEEFVKKYQKNLFAFYVKVKGPAFIEKLVRKHKLKKVNKMKYPLVGYTGICDFCFWNLGQYLKQDLDDMLLEEFSKDKAMQKLAVKESLKFRKNKKN